MKALSLKPEWAMPVLLGDKTVECRTWKTSYRGDLLICSSAKKASGCISGHALCMVSLDDVVPFTDEHLWDAVMEECPKDSYAWLFSNLRWIEPFPVKGKLNLFEVEDGKLKEIPETIDNVEALRQYYMPLVLMDKKGNEIWDAWFADVIDE